MFQIAGDRGVEHHSTEGVLSRPLPNPHGPSKHGIVLVINPHRYGNMVILKGVIVLFCGQATWAVTFCLYISVANYIRPLKLKICLVHKNCISTISLLLLEAN